MAEENQKSKAESQENKEANSNQFGEHSMMEMGSQIGEELEKMGKEMDGMNLQKEVGKLVEESSGLMAKDEDDQEEGILVPNWVIESLATITRIEMADSALSYSSRTFQRLCWPKLHGENVMPHFIDRMALYGKEDESGILQASIYFDDDDDRKLQLPLPNVSPPDYILGFKRISIYYLDARVLEFFKCVAPKLNDVQFLMFAMDEWGAKEQDKRTAMVDCLLNMLANKIGQFETFAFVNFAKFNQLFPGFIDQLDSLSIVLNEGIDVGVLYKWLINRDENEESKQKILELDHDKEFLRDFFVRVEQEFTKAIAPLNFLINFQSENLEFDEFTLKNEKTGEILISYQKQIDELHVLLLLRCPKGEEERWKEEGEKKLERNRQEDATFLDVKIDDFGNFNNMD